MNRQTKICAVAHILTGFFLLQVLPLAGQSPAIGTNHRKTVRLHAPGSSSAFTKTSTARPAMTDVPLNLAQSLTTSGTITNYAGSAGVPLPISDTVAITQSLDMPASVAPDGAGGFYFTSPTHNRVYRVTSDGKLFVVAGDGTAGFSGDGTAAISARLDTPLGVAVDAAGNIFIADYDNGRIRKVTPGGVISTVAGNGSYQGTGDNGPATSAGMGPIGVAVDAAGNIFIADTDNDRVRKVNTAGIITAFAGSGNNGFAGDNGPATSARLAAPVGVAVDTSGNVFLADYDNFRIRKVGTNGVITTIAGNGSYEYGGDGGPATSAGIGPTSIAVDVTGNLFIADFDNERIRKVTSSGSISTLAGTGERGFSGDGGPGTDAELRDPFGVAVDAAGNVFIADASNNRVRKVSPAGAISTVAGNGNAIRLGDDPSEGFGGDGGPAISALMSGPVGVAIDPAGNLFIADSVNNRIRKVTPAGVITTVAGTGDYGFSGDGGPATAAALLFPVAVAVDGAGNLFIADIGNLRVRKVSSSGVITTVA
jgi:sugar lactone lactonase YvrE